MTSPRRELGPDPPPRRGRVGAEADPPRSARLRPGDAHQQGHRGLRLPRLRRHVDGHSRPRARDHEIGDLPPCEVEGGGWPRLAINRGTDALASAVESESHRQDLSALERLRHAVHSSVLILIEYHHSVTLLLRVRGNSAVERDALERRRQIDMKIRALVTAAIEEGGVRADFPPGLVTRLLFGMVNSITEWYRPGYPVDPETIAEAVTAMAFNGLAE